VLIVHTGIDATNVGDEGGFAPTIQSSDEGLSIIVDAIAKAGYTGKVKIGMDIAASEFITEVSQRDCQATQHATNKT
jgi:enolase